MTNDVNPSTAALPSVRRSKSRLALILVIAVCLAPVLASYYFYYFAPPDARTNSGTLILPPAEVHATAVTIDVRPAAESGFLDVLAQRARQPEASATSGALLAQGQSATLGDFRGRWLMVWVGPSACAQDCLDALLEMRQIRLTTGRDRDRVERVFIRVPADASVGPLPALPQGLEGTWVLRAATDPLSNWVSRLPADRSEQAAKGLWLIDPQGHLMMHFSADTDPAKIKKDLIRLLKASRIG
ncbi:MAG: SCO family protein [Burkholderiaceae bacterium]|jgi:hypothetical protein